MGSGLVVLGVVIILIGVRIIWVGVGVGWIVLEGLLDWGRGPGSGGWRRGSGSGSGQGLEVGFQGHCLFLVLGSIPDLVLQIF
jgi:hypothetical protein